LADLNYGSCRNSMELEIATIKVNGNMTCGIKEFKIIIAKKYWKTLKAGIFLGFIDGIDWPILKCIIDTREMNYCLWMFDFYIFTNTR